MGDDTMITTLESSRVAENLTILGPWSLDWVLDSGSTFLYIL